MAASRKKTDPKTGSKAKRSASAPASAKRPASKKAPAKKSAAKSGPTASVTKKKAANTAISPKAAKAAKPAAHGSSARQLEPAATEKKGKTQSKTDAVRPKAKATKAKGPTFDRKWLRGVREALVGRRDGMLSVVQSTKAQMAQRGGDLADVSDRASEGFEDELAVGLMAIEAAQLEDVEGAIQRIDRGKYGLCEDCEKPIPRSRLEVLPFARRCLVCEGTSERMVRTHSPAYTESDDS